MNKLVKKQRFKFSSKLFVMLSSTIFLKWELVLRRQRSRRIASSFKFPTACPLCHAFDSLFFPLPLLSPCFLLVCRLSSSFFFKLFPYRQAIEINGSSVFSLFSNLCTNQASKSESFAFANRDSTAEYTPYFFHYSGRKKKG